MTPAWCTGLIGNAVRLAGEVSYRVGLGPLPSEVPDQALVDMVARWPGPTGRALDLGCGTGRNALYLARQGWEVTGVELVGAALTVARRRAAAAGVHPRLLQGDVTRLAELDVGDGYALLMDGGCYHMIPAGRREAYVASVSHVSAPDARLIMVGFTRVFGSGMSEEQIRTRFAGWNIVGVQPIPGDEMQSYVAKPALIKKGLSKGWFAPVRYLLQRT